MNKRQFLWGLSNGATMFALAGAFWIGLGVATVAARVHWAVSAGGTAIQVGGCVVLIWTAARLRRRSGFRRTELRQLEGLARAQARHIETMLRWTIGAQTLLVALAVWTCVRTRSEPLIWPAIGAVVSLHLVPLARIFHVKVYYATAVAGMLVCVGGFAMAGATSGVAWLGLGMATVMWVSAAYLLIHADRIADQALP